jgi:cobalt-zinc-cadmium efflux system outer membrane protein
MPKSKRTVLVAAALLAVSCASVPRDAGVAEIERTLAAQGLLAPAWAQTGSGAAAELPDGALTADQAVAFAMANNSRLQSELAELGIARADFIEASTVANPVFEFEIRLPGEPYRPYELRLAQSLIELIQLPRRRALGRVAFDAAQMRVSSSVLRFAGEVRIAYYDHLAASMRLALQRTAADTARTGAELAIKQHAAETISDLDLENEQALYEQAKLDLSRAERDEVLTREALARLMGVVDPTRIAMPPTFPPLPETERTDQQLQGAAALRLDLAIARRELEVAQRRIPITRLRVLDETVLDFHLEREPGGERTRGPGIEFPIPLFDTGRAARTRAEAEYLRARFAVSALESEGASVLRSASSALAESRARAEYYRDVIVPRRQRILQLTKLEHNAMLIGIYQLLAARQGDLDAQRDFIDAQREYWAARVDLDRALQGVAENTSFAPASNGTTGSDRNPDRRGH